MAGLIKGNQWVFIVPDHKACYFLGEVWHWALHPRKPTCPLKRDYFSREYIFQPLIFRGQPLVIRGGIISIIKTKHPEAVPPKRKLIFRAPAVSGAKSTFRCRESCDTVDGSDIRQSPVHMVVYPHDLQGFSTIPGGCSGFQPSTVVPKHLGLHIYRIKLCDITSFLTT